METRYRVIRPGIADEIVTVALPGRPGYFDLRDIVEPLLDGAHMEHVSVWAEFDGGWKYEALDMFVDDTGLLKKLPRNEAATTIYRRANLMGMSGALPVPNPEMLSYIAGTAVLFSRRVWF